MKAKVILISLLALFLSSSGYAQWIQQASGSTQALYSVYNFPLSPVIICAGNNSAILRTTNNGNNWSSFTAPGPSSVLTFVTGTTSGKGWICGNGVMYKTTNAGANWSALTVTAHQYFGISFTDDNTGWLAGSLDTVFRTTNGGVNWQAQYAGRPSSTVNSGIQFFNASTGYMWGFDSLGHGFVLRTTDTGTTWVSVFSYTYPITAFQMINSTVGFAASDVFFKTTNGGNNWVQQANPLATSIFGLNFPVDAGTGFAVSVDKILKTTNGGNSWNIYTHPSGGYLRSVNFKYNSNDTGFAVGNTGQILYTTNAGGNFTGIENTGSINPAGFMLKQNYPNPFNPNTVINYQLAINSFVTLEVFDIAGKSVTKLVNRNQNAGSYQVNFDGSNVASGIYFCKLTAGDMTGTKKMVLLK